MDESGKRGDEPGFDKSKIKVYGLGLDGGSGGGNGQTQWSMYTGSNNWNFTDKNPWGTHYNYDQPAFQQTIAWFKSLIDKGYMPSVEAVTGQSSSDIFAAGKYAMITNGSWMTNLMFDAKGIETGLAPTPVGPSGKRASMYNGLADSVWVGSQNKPAAVKWVEFLGSPDCQNIVGEKAVVFPRSRKRLRRPRLRGRPRESIPPRSPSRWTRRPPSCSRSPTMPPRSPES